jgi:hypothetical protein
VSEDLRHLIDELVAPMSQIAPADRRRGRAVARRHALIAVALVALLVLVAIAATWATLDLTASPERSPVSRHNQLACLDLVGGSAAHAEDTLKSLDYSIEWRFVTYDPPDGQTFTTTAPESVEPTTIVEDAAQGHDGSVIVFVHAADDTLAPPPTPAPCP